MKPVTSSFHPELTPEVFNRRSAGYLPGLVGLTVLRITPQALDSRLEVRRELMAPNGFLHPAPVIALADTSCGYGCVVNLPEGAGGFTTIELKANFVGTAREGAIACRATPVHLGRTTQVWDAVVWDEKRQLEGVEKVIALFRCTQMVLWQNPKP